MLYNLKETKTLDAETIDHLLTVLDSILQEKNDAIESGDTKLTFVKWEGAKQYLESYIMELFQQQKELR